MHEMSSSCLNSFQLFLQSRALFSSVFTVHHPSRNHFDVIVLRHRLFWFDGWLIDDFSWWLFDVLFLAKAELLHVREMQFYAEKMILFCVHGLNGIKTGLHIWCSCNARLNSKILTYIHQVDTRCKSWLHLYCGDIITWIIILFTSWNFIIELIMQYTSYMMWKTENEWLWWNIIKM